MGVSGQKGSKDHRALRTTSQSSSMNGVIEDYAETPRSTTGFHEDTSLGMDAFSLYEDGSRYSETETHYIHWSTSSSESSCSNSESESNPNETIAGIQDNDVFRGPGSQRNPAGRFPSPPPPPPPPPPPQQQQQPQQPRQPQQFQPQQFQPQQSQPQQSQRVNTWMSHARNHSANSTSSTSPKRAKRFSIQPRPGPSSPRAERFTIPGEPDDGFDRVGEEPGVDVDTMFVDIPDSRGSQITLIDYDSHRCAITHYDVDKDGGCVISGSSEPRFLRHHISDALDSRPSWSSVRWVVVNGLSWEAIQPIAMKYHLHPLAVEAALDIPQQPKMDVFPGQMFCCFPLHVLSTTPTPFPIVHRILRSILLVFILLYSALKSCARWLLAHISAPAAPKIGHEDSTAHEARSSQPSQTSSRATSTTSSFSFSSADSLKKDPARFSRTPLEWSIYPSCYPKSTAAASSVPLEEFESSEQAEECIPFYTIKNGTLCGDAESSPVATALREMPSRSIYEWNHGNIALKREAAQNMHIPGSTSSVEIALEQVSLFLVKDTVITFFEKSAPKIYRPLEARLRSPDTLLRITSDPAILIQAILDTNVDLIGPILNEYRAHLSRLQVQSIRQPNLKHTRALHAFMTDLSILRPPLRALLTIVEHNWMKHSSRARRKSERNATRRGTPRQTMEGIRPGMQTSPLDFENKSASSSSAPFSSAAELYFRDVADHASRYLQDLDDMRSRSRALTSLIFNTISIGASDSVKMLSLVSVVFLPLTFLTGYFGMNFKGFTVLENDVTYYWFVATPAAAALTLVVMYPSMVQLVAEVWNWTKEQI